MSRSLRATATVEANPRLAAPAHSRARARRVAFLVSHFPSGGAQEIMTDIADGLRMEGCEVRLFALYPLADAPSAAKTRLPWSWLVDRKPASVGGLLKLARALLRAFAATRPDAVVSALPAANIAAIVGARLAAPRAKVIIAHHSPVQTHDRLFNFIDGRLGGWRNVAAIVSVSDVVASSLEGKPAAYRAKRRTIRNALPPDIERFIATLATARPAGASTRVVVATGRLAEQKNYPALLRAAARMPNVTVRIVGGGEDEAKLKALARELGVEGRVEFLGRRSREETLKILAAGAVFAQPSLFEGHSLALIEAAKLGVPIVTSNAPEQVEGVTAADGSRCALLVDPQDDASLAREILRLLDRPEVYAHWQARARRLGDDGGFRRVVSAYAALMR
jgi:glycosyltransferase involved in cell wall biosynthesis